jgi:lysophospholipase L1-like esterase
VTVRVRTLWCAFLLVVATAGSARAAQPPYYLALGDSLSIGIQPKANGDYAPTTQGYVDDLYAFYRTRISGLRLKKLGCNGETTSSFISGLESGCTYPEGNQLAQAVAFIKAHRVALITLDIGGDNLLHCLSLTSPIDPACVTSASITAATDLAGILSTLQAAAQTTGQNVLIVGANYYDPFVATWILGPQGQALAAASLLATATFNQALETTYQLLQVPFADVAAVFRTDSFPANVAIALAWTWMSAQPPRGPDVHPNALGYLAIASAFSKAIIAP